MPASEIDNPIWSSLLGKHRAFVQGRNDVVRYPAQIASFVGVAHADVDAGGVLMELIASGESVYLLGIAPRVPASLRLQAFRPLAQMICTAPMVVEAGPEIVAMTDAHRADVLALTALVYPHYFREHTMMLGRYYGIYVDGRLAAMVGERLATESFQEVSAICTHPDFNGRGYARRLTAMLTNDILASGRTPFLHVSHENLRAKAMYERIGYRIRRDLPFWSLQRA